MSSQDGLNVKNLAYCGIGLRTNGFEGDTNLTVSLLPTLHESPARKAGIRDGDILEAVWVNGAWVKPATGHEAADIIGGGAGTSVRLKLRRPQGNEKYAR